MEELLLKINSMTPLQKEALKMLINGEYTSYQYEMFCQRHNFKPF